MCKISLTTIVLLLILSSFSLKAQEDYTIKCKMTIEQIVEIQSFHVDQVEYSKAEKITETLIDRFEQLYSALSDNNKTEALENKEHIMSALNSADIIKMDYSMFKEDIDFINNYDFN